MVISTIHQPGSQTYQLFDRLILMADGNIIYQGSTKEAVPYFNNLGFECPMYSNPADFFLKEFQMPFHQSEEDKIKVATLIGGYQKTIIPAIQKEEEDFAFDPNFEMFVFGGSGFWKQLRILSDRAFKAFIRNPRVLRTRIIQNIVLSFFTLSLYWKCEDDKEGIQNKIGVIMLLSL
jgi:hypothetical protein